MIGKIIENEVYITLMHERARQIERTDRSKKKNRKIGEWMYEFIHKLLSRHSSTNITRASKQIGDQ